MIKGVLRLCIILYITMVLTAHARPVTIAILAKDKAHVLEEYLECIEKQTWPKHKTYLYIRTNNNNDHTAAVLKGWLSRVRHLYKEVYYDDTDVSENVQQYAQHEWNETRFKVLGQIRNDSIAFARRKKSHYFVADCDNFLKPHVIEQLVRTGLPIIAPFLIKSNSYYSNYHAQVDRAGYYESNALYYDIHSQKTKGLIEVPVVHCTYLIRYEHLDSVSYDDGTGRYEYVIFSDNARKKGVAQYIDNREIYGTITMAEDRAQFVDEPWFSELKKE